MIFYAFTLSDKSQSSRNIRRTLLATSINFSDETSEEFFLKVDMLKSEIIRFQPILPLHRRNRLLQKANVY